MAPNYNKFRILSVLPLLGHPRDSKRISMLQEGGFTVEAVAFKREYHTGRLPGCQVKFLGNISNGRYLQRILKMILSLPKLRTAIKRNDLVYASGPDMAYMAIFAGLGLGKPIVLEVGDIRELQVMRGLKGRLIRMFDRLFVDACSLLIATAPGFVEFYYRQWLKASIPSIIIENKLESTYSGLNIAEEEIEIPKGTPLVDRPLRIGYFGGLRCEWSWHVLVALALAKPKDVEIVLAGYPMNPVNLPQLVDNYPNIKYIGQYRSPNDLPLLYNSVDLVWACYQPIGPDDWNLRWARPNRFYESCFFKKPMISRHGSSDSVVVEHYGIGMIITDSEIEHVVSKLCNITNEAIRTWTENMLNLPYEVYMYTTEKDELATALRNLLSVK